jgi:hypothetical protein
MLKMREIHRERERERPELERESWKPERLGEA